MDERLTVDDMGRLERGLLPGELVAPQAARRSTRDWLVDVVLWVVAVVVGLAVLADTWSRHTAFGAGVDIAGGLVALTALWWRRSWPALVAALVLAISALSALASAASLVALFSAAIRVAPRTLARLGVLAAAAVVAYSLLYPAGGDTSTELFLGALLTGLAATLGLFVRARRALVLALHERAARSEVEHALRLEQAREGERRRIAREMHDVLGHRVSLLVLHAGALEFRPDAPPREVAEAAGVIRAAARATLQDLRAVVGVLRDDTPTDGEVPPPQPTLASLPSLVAESQAAGVRVDARLEADATGVPLAVQRTAYRIVQEGLTNARRHAPGAAVALAVDREAQTLRVEVVSGAGTPADERLGPGTGLAGLRERVELVGGTLEHGRRGRGDFALSARLPWSP